jgi:FMN phosphatase YigB (HAD superfamily)
MFKYRGLKLTIAMPPTTIQVVFFDLGDTLINSDSPKFLPGAKTLLTQLHTRGVKLGIISNTGHLTREQITTLLPPDFDWAQFEAELVVLSSEVGFEKPDPILFEKAVAKAGLAASLCLYCSENLLETLVAQQVGLRTARLPSSGSDLKELLTALTDAGLIV